MMNASATMDEVCVLISAQLDMLEDQPLTPSQLVELHSRAERIRTLCNELEQVNGNEPVQVGADPYLNEGDFREDSVIQFARPRLRALAQAPAEDEWDQQLVEAA